MLIILISRKKKKYQNLNRYEVEKPLYSNLKGGWSRGQSCDPVGEGKKRKVVPYGVSALNPLQICKIMN